MVWEFEERIDLVISESVKIENDSLEVDNEDIRGLRNQGSLTDIYFLHAAVTLVVIDDLAFY